MSHLIEHYTHLIEHYTLLSSKSDAFVHAGTDSAPNETQTMGFKSSMNRFGIPAVE